MNKETIELIALGASAAVNCRPCMEYHFAAGRELGLPEEELRGALKVGTRVNEGAGKKTVEYIREHLDQNVSGRREGGCCG